MCTTLVELVGDRIGKQTDPGLVGRDRIGEVGVTGERLGFAASACTIL